MKPAGNLPVPARLAAQQRDFLSFVRNPTGEPPPGANPRALHIYADLVYRNLAGFISQFFPVCSQVCAQTGYEQAWQALIRAFIAHHPSQTPYFLAIAEEFVQFVLSKPPALSALPAYIPELAHYEWVELALDIADSPQPSPAAPGETPWQRPWQRSPLAWCLVYSYPVHLIGPDNPNPAPDTRAYVVYRDANLAVKFMALTLISAQWLQAITPQTTPQQALESLLQGDISGQILEQTQPILLEWIELGVLIPA
ncbi:MAG TPA: putative DNA-binding domain-containing protein [Cellvibrionaceae bacterium]|nr:putative DNA-binding domain-containing protein [Cellvibrionaceae bacterium]